MSPATELPVIGEIQLSTFANLRHGSPSLQAPVIRKVPAGTNAKITSIAAGDAIQGNSLWYRLDTGAFLWSGAAAPIGSTALVPVPRVAPSSIAQPNPDLNKTPLVVDISHGDGVISFADARNNGLAGVIHKATTGATGKDDAYKDRRADAKASGLLWGAYHWGTAKPIADQVANFLQWAEPDESTLVALDYETTAGNQMTLEGAREFCQSIFDALGRRPIIYSGDTLKSALGANIDPFFSQYRLWLSQYGDTPTVQRSFKDYWLWQYTDGALGPGNKKVPGIPGDAQGRLDCNHFIGSAEELAVQWVS